MTVVEYVRDAVRGVDLVQESAPERLELKQQLLAFAKPRGRAWNADLLLDLGVSADVAAGGDGQS
ncbi:hypothetical protein [Bradyrhizobium shewense]|uniref:hypothetical protein n=1 Tax=Bradyrhizobium shewense TaxID=1761772 RepID=UPI000AE195A4|nr:hypothetical protein [Bradyrhizobium shewense]